MLNLDDDSPMGLVLHVAGLKEKGWRVLDVWESREIFESFMKDRLMPAVQEVGLHGQPRVDLYDAYNLYAPGMTVLADAGGSSLPPSRQRAV